MNSNEQLDEKQEKRAMLEEKIRRKKQLEEILKKSDKLYKNFKLYFASYEGSTRHQASRITKEEYLKMQDKKYIGSSHEKFFFDQLPDEDTYINVKTFVVDKNNFALLFNQIVWNTLTVAEKLTALRVAWKYKFGKDVKEFCSYHSNGVVFVGKNYHGSINVGSIIDEKDFDNFSFDFLIKLFNAKNTIKDSYYMNQLVKKKKVYDTILDFDNFEEMQYISPLELIEEDLKKMTPRQLAIYYNDKYKTEYRKASLAASNLITEHSKQIAGLDPYTEGYLEENKKSIKETNELLKNFGETQKDRDREYLDIKVTIYNNNFIKEYNALVPKYNELLKEYNEAKYAIDQESIKSKMDIIRWEMDKIDAKKTTFEQALAHFNDHFGEDKKSKRSIKTLFENDMLK